MSPARQMSQGWSRAGSFHTNCGFLRFVTQTPFVPGKSFTPSEVVGWQTVPPQKAEFPEQKPPGHLKSKSGNLYGVEAVVGAYLKTTQHVRLQVPQICSFMGEYLYWQQALVASSCCLWTWGLGCRWSLSWRWPRL